MLQTWFDLICSKLSPAVFGALHYFCGCFGSFLFVLWTGLPAHTERDGNCTGLCNALHNGPTFAVVPAVVQCA